VKKNYQNKISALLLLSVFLYVQFPFCAFHHQKNELKCIYTDFDSSADVTHGNTHTPHLHNGFMEVCFLYSAHPTNKFLVQKNNFSVSTTPPVFVQKLVFNSPEKELENSLQARAPPQFV